MRTARERLYGAVENTDADGEAAASPRERTLEDLVEEWGDEANGD